MIISQIICVVGIVLSIISIFVNFRRYKRIKSNGGSRKESNSYFYSIVFSIVTLVVSYAGDEIFDELKTNPNLESSEMAVAKVDQVQGLMTGAFDQLVFFIVLGVVLSLAVIAIFSDFHPIFVVFLIIVIIFMIIVAGLMANVHDEITSTDILSKKAEEFTMTNWVMGANLPIIIAVGGVIAILIILAKRGKVTSPV